MNFAKHKNSTTILLGIGFIAAGIAQWTITLSEINMINITFILRWSLAALLAGLAGGLISSKSPLKVALFGAIGATTAILMRALFDILVIDPSSHNLIPFELVLGFILAFPVMLIGAGVAYRLNRSR